MATTSFTIHSHYDPGKDKERLQRETGQVPDAGVTQHSDDEALWREAASAHFLRAQRPPPKFVPATIAYEVDSDPGQSKSKPGAQDSLPGTSLSSWYRSLTNVNDSDSASRQPRPSSAPIPTSSSSLENPKESMGAASNWRIKDKNNWFIHKVLRSEPPSAPSTPPPTLADILAREPPPLPSEPKYNPPVWIEIGPTNKGFAMLQKGGWSEGEALGAGARRRQASSASTEASYSGKGKGKAVAPEETEIRASRIGKQESRDDIAEVGKGQVNVIDLTLSDYTISSGEEEVESVKTEKFTEAYGEVGLATGEDSEDRSAHGHTALLTPIATALKLDRLGIGLKAKTEGPYKASVKRVTHNAAALAAHIKTAQEARKRREKFGRGHRGYERQKRKEEEKRRNLLAYMNT